MAGVEMSSGGRGKRPMNAEINMIPFVDLLLVTVAFLLVTAVWVSHARLTANADVPSRSDDVVVHDARAEVLDVRVGDDDIVLAWKQGNAVMSERRVTRDAGRDDLVAAFTQEWQQHGSHKSDADTKVDQAIIHSDNRLPFKDLVSVMDALYAPKRALTTTDGRSVSVPVWNATFSVR